MKVILKVIPLSEVPPRAVRNAATGYAKCHYEVFKGFNRQAHIGNGNHPQGAIPTRGLRPYASPCGAPATHALVDERGTVRAFLCTEHAEFVADAIIPVKKQFYKELKELEESPLDLHGDW